MFTMRTTPEKLEAKPTPTKPADTKFPEIASASVPDTLAALHVNPDTGLSHADVDVRRKEHGYNEVAEQKGHPVLMFLGKFWGLSAWMLELIMVLSVVLRKYSDLAVVGALLVVNAVLSFMQSIGPPASSRRCDDGYRSMRACGAIRTGRSFPPES
jgi:magnesium-transporting ATPase (P-type)